MTRKGTRIRRALRLAGWNALLLLAGLALIGVAGETYFRLRTPFSASLFAKRGKVNQRLATLERLHLPGPAE